MAFVGLQLENHDNLVYVNTLAIEDVEEIAEGSGNYILRFVSGREELCSRPDRDLVNLLKG